jgi:hypothetical protein
MAREAGSSQGFGRVSPVTHPSPYSPVQFRGRQPAAAGTAEAAAPRVASAARSRRRTFGRRTAVVVAVVAALVAGIGYVGLFRSTVAPPRAVVAPAAVPPPPVTLDDEARRIARSAIAVTRR